MSVRDRKSETFVITGTIQERETGRPLRNLVVRAFDRDLLLDDKVGFRTRRRALQEISFEPRRDVMPPIRVKAALGGSPQSNPG